MNSNAPESADCLASALQAMTLRVAGAVLERVAELFCALRNDLTDEDLRRNAAVLQNSPVITTLVPFTLANLEGLVDSKVRRFAPLPPPRSLFRPLASYASPLL